MTGGSFLFWRMAYSYGVQLRVQLPLAIRYNSGQLWEERRGEREKKKTSTVSRFSWLWRRRWDLNPRTGQPSLLP